MQPNPSTEHVAQELLDRWQADADRWQAEAEAQLLADILEEYQRAQPQPGVTGDLATVQRYAKVHRRITNEIETAKAQHQAHLAQLYAQLRAHEHHHALEAMQAARRCCKHGKTVITPFGNVGWRCRPQHLEVVRQENLPEQFWRTKIERTVNKPLINAAYKETGEVVPGCEVVPAEDRFYPLETKEFKE